MNKDEIEGAKHFPASEVVDESSTVVKERPKALAGVTYRVKTGVGKLYITVNELDGKPFEVFATIGKSGKSVTAKAEAIGRMVSLLLRSGVAVDKIVDQLKGIGGEHPLPDGDDLVLSIPDGVAKILEGYSHKGGE